MSSETERVLKLLARNPLYLITTETDDRYVVKFYNRFSRKTEFLSYHNNVIEAIDSRNTILENLYGSQVLEMSLKLNELLTGGLSSLICGKRLFLYNSDNSLLDCNGNVIIPSDKKIRIKISGATHSISTNEIEKILAGFGIKSTRTGNIISLSEDRARLIINNGFSGKLIEKVNSNFLNERQRWLDLSDFHLVQHNPSGNYKSFFRFNRVKYDGGVFYTPLEAQNASFDNYREVTGDFHISDPRFIPSADVLVPGVRKTKQGNYRVGINLNYKNIHIGIFENESEAKLAYFDSYLYFYGKFHGRDIRKMKKGELND